MKKPRKKRQNEIPVTGYEDDPRRYVGVRLELSLREKAKKLGNGNISDGIRLALLNA